MLFVFTILTVIHDFLVKACEMLRIPWKGDTIPCHGVPATHSKEAAFIILSNKIFQNCSIVYECMKFTDRRYFSKLEVKKTFLTLSSPHWPHLTH